MKRLACLFILAFCALGGAAEAPDPFLAGKAALEDGLYEIAQKQLEIYLESAGRDAPAERVSEALTLLGRALRGQGKQQRILDFIAENRKRFDGAAEGAVFSFWEAQAKYELGDPEGALKILSAFEDGFGDTKYLNHALRLRAWCHLQLKQTDLALAAFARFDAHFGGEAGGRINLLEWGKVLLAQGRIPEAGSVLRKLSNIPEATDVVLEGRYWLGRVMMATQSWEEAAAILGDVAGDERAKDNLRAEAWYALGTVYRNEESVDDAMVAFNRGIARAKSPRIKQDGRCRLGLLQLGSGNVNEGIATLKSFITEAPDHPEANGAQLRLAEALYRHGQFERAASEYQYYLETFTNVTGQADAHSGKGWALMQVGRNAEAATAFGKAYEIYGDADKKQRSLFKVGDAYFANAQYKLAAQTYEQLIAEFTGTELVPAALFQLAESRARAGESDAAERQFLDLIERFPATPEAEEALLRVGELRESREAWNDAIGAYERLMTGYTNSAYFAQALLGRGLVKYRLYRFQEAMTDFQAIIDRFPAGASAENALQKLAMSLYWLGRDEEAVKLARQFLEKYPESALAPQTLFWLAKHSFNAENFEEAEKIFLGFADRYPKHADAETALLWAGRAAARRSEYIRAIECLTRLIKDYPEGARTAEARFAQGDALSQLGKFSEAIVIFQEIVNRYPGSELMPETWIRIGDCRFMLGSEEPVRYEEAIEAFKVVAENPDADPDLVLQARYKIGRCLEKMGRLSDAVEQYYTQVMVGFLEDRDSGFWHTKAAKTWFWRASRDAADILEAREEWRKVVSILERVLGTGVPDEPEIRERISKIRSDHWWLFY